MRALAKNLKNKKQQESSNKNNELEQRIDYLLKRQQEDDEAYMGNDDDVKSVGQTRLQSESDSFDFEPSQPSSTSSCCRHSSSLDFGVGVEQTLLIRQSTAPPPLGSHPSQKWRLDLQNLRDASAAAKSEKQDRGEVTPDTARRIQQLLGTSTQKPTTPLSPPQPPSKCIILVTTEFLLDGWDRNGNAAKEEEFLKSLAGLLGKGKDVTETTVYIPYSVLNDIDSLLKRTSAVIVFLENVNTSTPVDLDEKHKNQQNVGDALITVLKALAPEHTRITLKRCLSLLNYLRRVLSLLRIMSNSRDEPRNLLENAALKRVGPSLCPYTDSDDSNSQEDEKEEEMPHEVTTTSDIPQWARAVNNKFRRPEIGSNLLLTKSHQPQKERLALRKAFVQHVRMNPYTIAGAPLRDQLYHSLRVEGLKRIEINSLRSTFGIPLDDKEAYALLRSKKLHIQHIHEAEQAQAESEKALLTAQEISNGFSSILNFHIRRAWVSEPSVSDSTKHQMPMPQKQKNKDGILNDRSIKTLVSAVVAYRRTYYTNVVINGLLRISEGNPNSTPSSVENKTFYSLPQRTSQMTKEFNQHLFRRFLQGKMATTKSQCFEWPMPSTEIAPIVFVLCGSGSDRPKGNFSTNFIAGECFPSERSPNSSIPNFILSLEALWHSRTESKVPEPNTTSSDVDLLFPKNVLSEGGWVELIREKTSFQNEECETLTRSLRVDPISLRNAAIRRVSSIFKCPPPEPKIVFTHNLGTLELAAKATQFADNIEFFYEPSHRSNISGCEGFEWDTIVEMAKLVR